MTHTAEIVGGYRWLETRLFELTGRWAADPSLPEESPVPAIRVHFDELRAQHAWHASEWADRLPMARGFDRDALTDPPGIGARDALSALEDGSWIADPASGPGTDRIRLLGRLAGLHRVILPRLVTTYERHRSVAAPAADRPVLRVLSLVLRDEVEAIRAGEGLLEELMAGSEDVRAAAQAVEHIEGVIVASGVRRGIVCWPQPRVSDRAT
jgi:hypothetical protein